MCPATLDAHHPLKDYVPQGPPPADLFPEGLGPPDAKIRTCVPGAISAGHLHAGLPSETTELVQAFQERRTGYEICLQKSCGMWHDKVAHDQFRGPPKSEAEWRTWENAATRLALCGHRKCNAEFRNQGNYCLDMATPALLRHAAVVDPRAFDEAGAPNKAAAEWADWLQTHYHSWREFVDRMTAKIENRKWAPSECAEILGSPQHPTAVYDKIVAWNRTREFVEMVTTAAVNPSRGDSEWVVCAADQARPAAARLSGIQYGIQVVSPPLGSFCDHALTGNPVSGDLDASAADARQQRSSTVRLDVSYSWLYPAPFVPHATTRHSVFQTEARYEAAPRYFKYLPPLDAGADVVRAYMRPGNTYALMHCANGTWRATRPKGAQCDHPAQCMMGACVGTCVEHGAALSAGVRFAPALADADELAAFRDAADAWRAGRLMLPLWALGLLNLFVVSQIGYLVYYACYRRDTRVRSRIDAILLRERHLKASDGRMLAPPDGDGGDDQEPLPRYCAAAGSNRPPPPAFQQRTVGVPPR